MNTLSRDVDVEALLAKLTLDEKISLLAAKDWWRTPVIEREGVFVPHIKTTDGPNGARGESYVSGIRAACFPCATNLGATFDTQILYQIGLEIGKEAISKAANVLLGPTLNVIRSPLGGRTYETYSEDPFVLGTLAAAYINGCQSQGIAATPKHFVANEAENRRRELTVNVDEQTLREIYLRPFQLLMKLSTPLCFMTSYNQVNGTYVADSDRLIDKVLREEWGFEGLVMSDWMGTYSTAKAMNAGLDLEMPGPTKWRGKKLLNAIEKNDVSIKKIDKSARRVLQFAKSLQRFEHPIEAPEVEVEDPKRDEFIRDAAADGMVLLKNENNILPIPHNANVAIIGYLAKVASLGGGGSAKVNPLHVITPLEGFEKLGIKHTYEPGVPVFGTLPHADPDIVSATDGKNTTNNDSQPRPVKLEWFNGPIPGTNLAHEEMIPNAEYMIKELWPSYLTTSYTTRLAFSITPQTSGNHIFSIITTGKSHCYINSQLIFTRPQEKNLLPESFYFFKSKLERRFNFSMLAGQKYDIVLESWATDPDILNSPTLQGKMFQGAPLRFFEFVDIQAAIENAALTAGKADYAVVYVGNTNEIESEGYDRETIDLPGEQYALIAAVAAKNVNTVVVNFSGAPVTLTQVVEQAPAILQAWFPGQECGDAVTRAVMGIVEPGGRLPFSWPKKIEDTPSFGHFPVDENDVLEYKEGLDVGYRFYDREDRPDPLFPFGFGLSYTRFEIGGLKTGAERMEGKDGKIEVNCQVKNVGARFGKCVVFFFVEMPETRIGNKRPVKELKGFAKVAVEAGKSGMAMVTLDRDSVCFYDAEKMYWRAQKGIYTVHVGTSVVDIMGKVTFEVADDFTWTGA